MKASGRRPRRRLARLAGYTLACAALTPAAQAGPWVEAAGAGSTSLALRGYDATREFPPGHYGSATQGGSEQRYAQLRLSGSHGLGQGLALSYDLRAARVEKIHTHHGIGTRERATGVQDQTLGIEMALTQRPDFAAAIGLSLVAATGSTTQVPALGVGHGALEPDLLLGWAGAHWRFAAQTGARVFADSGVTQLRADLDLGLRVAPRVDLAALLFYVRTVGGRSPLPATDAAERYNLLRPGIRLKFLATPQFKPYLEFEQDVAGEGIHAGRRYTLGLSYAY
ncbi:MAG: hypothetical protein KGL18_08030 [Burkholderiales bacterium]|nr:hypothetical protein [Burkholderiales bacterium]MDE1928987.1 hypothetical protein [Burkholderiales bacterium]MDE2159781.1 hypothetical protein [Burkholderiales bacterium]MDE2502907.1 hypothetical protein [Burkholderiales bacterium]